MGLTITGIIEKEGGAVRVGEKELKNGGKRAIIRKVREQSAWRGVEEAFQGQSLPIDKIVIKWAPQSVN
jgi:hypothetical protein